MTVTPENWLYCDAEDFIQYMEQRDWKPLPVEWLLAVEEEEEGDASEGHPRNGKAFTVKEFRKKEAV